MRKYIALGCSLTHFPGYVNYLNSTRNMDILNLAIAAGSNALQSFRLNNCLVRGDVGKETTLLWQITNPERHFNVLEEKFAHNKISGDPFDMSGSFDWYPEVIEPHGVKSITLLCNNRYAYPRIVYPLFQFHNTICDIYKWSHLVDRIVVYLGWSWFLGRKDIDQALTILESLPNVDIIPVEKSILDYCRDKKLQFDDDLHPSEESYNVWCEDVLVPLLFKE